MIGNKEYFIKSDYKDWWQCTISKAAGGALVCGVQERILAWLPTGCISLVSVQCAACPGQNMDERIM